MSIVKTYDPITFTGSAEDAAEIIAFADDMRGVLMGREDNDDGTWTFVIEVHEPWPAERGDPLATFIASKQG